MVFVSLGARVKLNAEALNMVESVGSYVRHRRVPVVVRSGGGFTIRYVPAISGESLGHAYQVILASLAGEAGLNVCENCRMGYFLKHSRKSVFLESEKGLVEIVEAKGSDEQKSHNLEKKIIEVCAVEDVGGFLYAEEPPTKRTSRVAFGYMIPVEEYITSAALEAQFHVRYSPAPRKGEQAIFNVEVGSAVYGLSAYLDVDGVGYTSMIKRELAVSEGERVKRVELALKSLAQLIGNLDFGAKKTRFLPSWEIVNAVAAVSHPLPFQVSSPTSKDYLNTTVRRAGGMVKALRAGETRIDESIVVHVYPGGSEPPTQAEGVSVVKHETLEELVESLLDEVKKGPRA